MEERIGEESRQTGEVDIAIRINLDPQDLESREYEVSITTKAYEPDLDSGALTLFIHFFQQIFRHARWGGYIKARGDILHHVLEDIGRPFGEAFTAALGDRSGIERASHAYRPLDGSMAFVAVDLSGRPWSHLDLSDISNRELAGMVQHVLEWIALYGEFNISGWVKTIDLPSDHHLVEALAKALAQALRHASEITDPLMVIPSTKETLVS